jgi:hypothetical protein
VRVGIEAVNDLGAENYYTELVFVAKDSTDHVWNSIQYVLEIKTTDH